MIDIHHHLLWGLDDGASSLESSIAMARIAKEDGITHIVCSPHANSKYAYEPLLVADRISTLQRVLDREAIEVKLGYGCDFHMSYDNIQEARLEPAKFSINGLGYLLVEIPEYGISRGLTEVFYQLQLSGLTPILTHPERNPTLQSEPGRLVDWLRSGVLIQITAGSVIGRMGRHAERMAHELLGKRWVHFLATDAHNTTSRPPRMREAFDLVAKKHGTEYAQLLCTTNPLSAFTGKPLQPQFEPLNLYDDMEKKSWWQKLTRR